jgi:hypothetical protein
MHLMRMHHMHMVILLLPQLFLFLLLRRQHFII